jgi:glycosyltransferase involved in cell wall biosynthesis
MRVLHLTPELPYESGGGGRGHEYLMCRRLVDLGHSVLNISPVLPEEAQWTQALRDAGVENWIAERPASHQREAAAAVIAEPAILGTALAAPVRALEMRVFWVRLRALAERAVRDWQPDVVVVVHDMAAAWARELPDSLPAVLSFHDLHWRFYNSLADRRTGPLAPVARAEAQRHRRHVIRHLPRYRAALALSTIEADELRAITEMPICVIPVGVDTSVLRPTAEEDGPPRLVFTGTLSYSPNVGGLRWFANRVWPMVRNRVPDCRLDVVGRDPAPEVSALHGQDGITVVGPVPDMAPYFTRAHAVVVPVLAGTGIRVKIIEAMAAGRAIVSTSLGSEGLPYLEPNRHLLVADDPGDFATAAARLLQEPELRRRLAGEARLLAERRYDWRRLGDQEEAVLRAVVGGGSPS